MGWYKNLPKKNLKSPQWLRNIKTKKRSIWNIFKDKEPQLIKNGGWHFSFLKETSRNTKKLFHIHIKNLIRKNLQKLKILKIELSMEKIYLIEI